MKKIEEVKEYFKNAKEVRCLSSGVDHDLTKIKIIRDIHEYCDGFWIDAEIESKNILLCENDVFAKIIYYKDNKPEFEHLEEIEVSDDNKKFEKLKFIGLTSLGLYVVEDYNYCIETVKHARKIKHERNKAIESIKELINKFDIKKEEL